VKHLLAGRSIQPGFLYFVFGLLFLLKLGPTNENEKE